MANADSLFQTGKNAKNLEPIELDFNSMCRLCGNVNINSFSVFTKDGNEIEERQKIEDYLNISISLEDELPKKLCIHCCNTLSSWHKFYESCHEMNVKFSHMVNQTKNEDPPEVPEEEEVPAVEEEMEEEDMEEHIEYLRDENEEDEGENLDMIEVVKEDIEETHEDASVEEEEEPKQSESKIFVCEICHHVFNRKSNLVRHLGAHRADHPCRVCCLSFATEFGLRQHSREHTADECAAAEETQPKVTCGSCDDVFSSKYLLYRHERNVHDSGEKFSCSKCSEILPSMPLLFAHERRHREFRCKICGKTLKSQVALNEHQNSHSGEKPFKCECGKAFAYNSNLVEHRKMHTMVKEHKCSHCDKAFRRSNMLKEHERVHTRDRPFKCSFCGADFTQSNSLKKHIRKFHRMCQQCGEYVGDDIDEMIHKCSDSK